MKEVILIVDDDKDDIKNFKDHIDDLQGGYAVECEENFSKTVEKIEEIRREGKKVVAVFIDLFEKKKSRTTGLDTISAVKSKFDDILIVAFTLLGQHKEEAENRGADWFWLKEKVHDIKLEELKKRIEKHNKEHNIEHTHHKDWFVDIILRILDGIHNSMTRITNSKNRHAKRNNVYKIEDEYDLQDLVWTILKPIFPEMTNELPIAKHMGVSSRADFYIPEVKTILELKYIKSDDYAKEIPKQLDNDITWYGELPQAENLIFYILKGDKINFDFNPMIKNLNKNNLTRESKTWKFIICIVHPK